MEKLIQLFKKQIFGPASFRICKNVVMNAGFFLIEFSEKKTLGNCFLVWLKFY